MIIKDNKSYVEIKNETEDFYKKNNLNPLPEHTCQKLIDYYVEKNKFTDDPEQTRAQIMGLRFPISFREFVQLIDETYIIKEVSHMLLGY